MKGFSTFSKSAFWSPFLLGMMAILAFPAVTKSDHRFEHQAVDQQILVPEFGFLQKAEAESPLFLQQTDFSRLFIRQVVVICEFFVKPYRLFTTANPPIRAGPSFKYSH